MRLAHLARRIVRKIAPPIKPSLKPFRPRLEPLDEVGGSFTASGAATVGAVGLPAMTDYPPGSVTLSGGGTVQTASVAAGTFTAAGVDVGLLAETGGVVAVAGGTLGEADLSGGTFGVDAPTTAQTAYLTGADVRQA